MSTILLIAADDDTKNGFLDVKIFQVNTAQNAAEALVKVRTTPFDFILFCSAPPHELMQNIRAAKPNLNARVLIAGITEATAKQRGWTEVTALGPSTTAEAVVRAVTQLRDAKTLALELDTDFVECAINSIGKSLLARFRIRNVLPEGSSYVKSADTPFTDFSALIALVCNSYEGIIALSFPKATIDTLARTSAEGSRTLNVTEIFNGVAGDLAQTLRTHGFVEREPHALTLLETPKVRAAPANCSRTLLWVLDCDAGKFYVQFFLAN